MAVCDMEEALLFVDIFRFCNAVAPKPNKPVVFVVFSFIVYEGVYILVLL